MSNLKQNNKIIIAILLIIILIFGTILVLKMTGIIKPPEEKQINSNSITNTSITTKQQNNKTYTDFNVIIKKIERTFVIISIITLIVSIGLNIGICKLYSKLYMPNYIVVFNFIWPLLTIFDNILPYKIQLITSLLAGVLGIMTFWYYFKAVRMSGWWALLPFVAMLLTGLGTPFMLILNSSLLANIGIACFVAFIVAYIMSNIKLAKIFDKGTGFTVGLALLPFIFQAILGYEKD